MKVIVVGAGSFGSWSALKLLEAGCEVTLIDAWGPGNSRSSSGGETRVIRTVYGSDELYIEMAHQAIDEWSHFQKSANESLMEMTGSLWFCGEDDAYVQSAIPKIQSLGLSIEEVSISETRRRWPEINCEGLNKVFLEPLAGFLRARLACSVLVREFVKRGGAFVNGQIRPLSEDSQCHQVELESGEKLNADQIVLAAGPWLGKLFPSLNTSIEVSRQEVYYFGPPAGGGFDAGRFPVWLDLNPPIYYGIPSVDRRGFKLALDERGPIFDPDRDHRLPTPELVQAARKYLAYRFPVFGDAPLLEARVCQYSNSPDGHFILDRHDPSGVIVAGGGSGHGFKMGPAIADRVVQLVQQNQIEPVFSLNRFEKLKKTSTQFDHSESSDR